MFSFNKSTLKKTLGPREPGEYPAELFKVGTGKSKSGNPMITLSFKDRETGVFLGKKYLASPEDQFEEPNFWEQQSLEDLMKILIIGDKFKDYTSPSELLTALHGIEVLLDLDLQIESESGRTRSSMEIVNFRFLDGSEVMLDEFLSDSEDSDIKLDDDDSVEI